MFYKYIHHSLIQIAEKSPTKMIIKSKFIEPNGDTEWKDIL